MGGVFNPLTLMVSLMLGVGFGLPVYMAYRFIRFTVGI